MIYNLSYLLSYFNLIACYFNLGVEFITVKLGYHHSYAYQYSLSSLLSNSDLLQLYAISQSIKRKRMEYMLTRTLQPTRTNGVGVSLRGGCIIAPQLN
jgi:hypothetical protein